MKRKLQIGFGLALALSAGLGGTRPASAAPVELAPGAVRAYFVIPVSHDLAIESTWIDLVACYRGRCDYLIDRIRGSELKTRGGFHVKLTDEGDFILEFRPTADSEPITVARTSYASGWYAPVELCSGAGTSQQCRYRVERDNTTQSLSMRIQVRK